MTKPVPHGAAALPWLVRALGEPTRWAVYQAVQHAGRPMTRQQVAEAVGIPRRMATFHLDRLANDGLLQVHYARSPGRPGGPGAGRPAKWYRPSDVQIELSIPPRRTDLAATIMALALEQLGAEGPHRDALFEQAAACGHRLANGGGTGLRPRLAEIGYDPMTSPDGTVELRNCPFQPVVEIARGTICPINQALLTALISAKAPNRYQATLEPAEDRCCVLLRPVPTAAGHDR